MPPLAPAPIAPPNVAPGSNISTITDKVTGNSYSRDTSVPNSTYQLVPKTPVAPTAPSAPQAPTGGGSAPDASTSTEDQVAQSLGYPSYAAAISTLTAAPTESETQLYNDAYSAAGLDDLNNSILSRQNDLADAQKNIDDNPWLDEADRVGRAKTVTDLANADIKNLQTNYATRLKSVEDLVTRESADNTASAAANKAKLAALEAQAKAATTAQTAATKTANTAPKTVKGSTTGATYEWDPTTQSFRAIIPATPKAPAAPKAPKGPSTSDPITKIQSVMGTLTGPDGKVGPADWQNALNEWMAAGYSESSFVMNFKSYANTKDPTQHYAGLN